MMSTTDSSIYDANVTEITSVGSLLELLVSDKKKKWFRGQGYEAWGLVPGIMRNDAFTEHESEMFAEFKRDALARVEKEFRTDGQWLALAQHYGLPTRLLDWTENALVALYFACKGEPDLDGRLFLLYPALLNGVNYKPHVGIIDIDDFSSNDALRTYLDGYEPHRPPIAVTVKPSFDRVISQQGSFTIHQNKDDFSSHEAVKSFVIPKASKAKIIDELAILGCTSKSVFPDLASLATYIAEQY